MKTAALAISILIAGFGMAFSINYLEANASASSLCFLEIPILCICGYSGVFIYTRFPNTIPVSSLQTLLIGTLSSVLGAIVYKLPYSSFSLAPPVTEPVTSFFIYLALILCRWCNWRFCWRGIL
jgi:hypothetical protein